MVIKYQLISASGNPTAIVYGNFAGSKKQKINQAIFKTNKLVEQIGYLYRDNDCFKFEMMGNEFSGNGCRSAAFSLLGMKSGKIKFYSSGLNKPIEASIDENLVSNIKVPYSFDKKKIIPNKFGFMLKIFGSYLIVLENKKDGLIIQEIISGIPKKAKAIGVMFIEKTGKKQIKLNPFFYVKQTQTLINETACGSGSVATAIYLSYQNRRSIQNLQVIQPSGQLIVVNAKYYQQKITQITISGPTKLLGDYVVEI